MKLPLRFALAVIACPLLTAADDGPPKVGDGAPDFSLRASDGKTYQLADFRGRQAVVLAWYPRAFTGGCTKECLSFRDHGDQLRAFDIAYLAASCDPLTVNADFAKQLKLDYPLLSDPTGAAATAFGVYVPDRKLAKRVTFLIGVDGKIQFIDTRVNAARHAQDVVTRLKELGVKQRADTMP